MKLPRPDYYQGILQLRGINEEMMSFVRNLIGKRDDVAITKTVKLHDGTGADLYITSQKYIRVIGKKLRDSFGGELKISPELHTRNRQGKDLYRVNVMFRLPVHRVGDTIDIRGEKLKLISLGRKIFAKNIKTGKKVMVRGRDLPRN